MASAKVERPTDLNVGKSRTHQRNKSTSDTPRQDKKFIGGNPSPRKLRRNYKRSYSFTFDSKNANFKRRRKEEIVPPTKFLLGGNITDPLNLGSLADEEINRLVNAVTPRTSPMPTPKYRKEAIEVLIPPNINDPLNLNGGDDVDLASQLISPSQIRKKKRPKKRKRPSGEKSEVVSETLELAKPASDEKTADEQVVDAPCTEKNLPSPVKEKKSLPETDENKIVSPVIPQPGERKRNRKLSSPIKDKKQQPQKKDNEIVSPVIPQPGERKRNSIDRHHRRFHHHRENKKLPQVPVKSPKFRAQDSKFQYGNYNQYYGYRNAHKEDPRLNCFQQSWFEGKDVLDIGCNIGHISLSVASDFLPRSVVGIDIDKKLIEIAKKNTKHYMSKDSMGTTRYPMSMSILYGPLTATSGPVDTQPKFPNNLKFIQGNYILSSDDLVDLEQPQFDVILCLSVTKWVHLNWGDAGVKRLFRRVFAQLRPGGIFILEAQPWTSYKKKKKLTKQIFENYQSIQLPPAKFTQYLLSDVGFSKCEVIGTPEHQSQGFCRPIQLYTKGEPTPSQPSSSIDTPNRYHEVVPMLGSSRRNSVDLGYSIDATAPFSSEPGDFEFNVGPSTYCKIVSHEYDDSSSDLPASSFQENAVVISVPREEDVLAQADLGETFLPDHPQSQCVPESHSPPNLTDGTTICTNAETDSLDNEGHQETVNVQI